MSREDGEPSLERAERELTTDRSEAGGGSGSPGDAVARAALERVRAAVRGETGRRRAGSSSRRGAEPSRAARRASPGMPGDQPYSAGRDPVPVASTVDRLLAEQGWERRVSVAGVIGRWRELVGDHLADHCRPETFEEGALVVRADSTAWAMQVRLLVPQLERRLEEEVGAGVVESVTVLGPGGPTWRRGPRSVPGRGPRDTYG